MGRIDPVQIAQFFALPGASELVEAFSAIPPGPVRDSVVNHAQVLAQAAGWTAPVPFVVGDLDQTKTRLMGSTAPRLSSPYAEGLVAKSIDGQIVERLMRGEAPNVVADDMRIQLGVVLRVKKKAARDGVVFPDDPKAAGKAKKGGKHAKAKRLNLARLPVPAPPYWWQDPDSPVWDNPSLLPGFSETGEGSMAAVGPLSSRIFKVMARAAENNGLTMRQYIQRRVDAVARCAAGEDPAAVARSVRMEKFAIYKLLRSVGQGRMETLNARPWPLSLAPEPPARPAEALGSPDTAEDDAPSVDDIDELRRDVATLTKPWERRALEDIPAARQASAIAARTAAATLWGFPDLAAYEAARDDVRLRRMRGLSTTEIAEATGRPYAFVKGAVDFWKGQGAAFPPLPHGRPAAPRVASR